MKVSSVQRHLSQYLSTGMIDVWFSFFIMGGDAQLSFVQMFRVELLRKRHDQCLPLNSLSACEECDCYFACICYLYSFFNVALGIVCARIPMYTLGGGSIVIFG